MSVTVTASTKSGKSETFELPGTPGALHANISGLYKSGFHHVEIKNDGDIKLENKISGEHCFAVLRDVLGKYISISLVSGDGVKKIEYHGGNLGAMNRARDMIADHDKKENEKLERAGRNQKEADSFLPRMIAESNTEAETLSTLLRENFITLNKDVQNLVLNKISEILIERENHV